mgnify:CR=1 FL=1
MSITNSNEPILNRKVIFSIFAGRQRYLTILFRYLDTMLKMNIIHEIHLWDFTRNVNDEDYIKDITKNNSNYKYMFVHDKNSWNEYYKYYF